MKVAFISQPWNRVSPPVESGSVAIWNYQVARRLSKACEVTVYVPSGAAAKNVEYSEGVSYRYIATSIDRLLLKLLRILSRFNGPKRPFFASWLYYFEYILRVSLDLGKAKYDVVHVQNLSQFVPVIRTLNRGVKVVLHMHCEWLTQLDYNLILRRLRKADLLVGCSDYITDKVRHRFPQLADRCQTVYNGVDASRTRIKSNGRNGTVKRIIFVGRISPEKGLHVLLNAFRDVVRDYPEVQLDIIGPQAAPPVAFIFKVSDDPKVAGLVSFCHRDYLTQLREQLPPDLANSVSFSGAIPHSVLAERYAEADIYVQPSLIEAFPLPVPEAMAAGIPVVGTRVGGIPEAVEDGVTGRLVDSDDVEALTAAILQLLSDEEMRRSMGKSAQARVIERFSWEQVSERLLDLYNGLIMQA